MTDPGGGEDRAKFPADLFLLGLAAEWFADTLQRIGVNGSADRPTVPYVWAAYKATDRYRRLHASTKRNYENYVQRFVDWIGEERVIDTVTDADLRAFRDSLELSPGTVNFILFAPLSRLFRYALRRGWVRSNPIEIVGRVPDPRTPVDARQMFTTRQMDALEQADPDNAHVWAFYRWTGARTTEGVEAMSRAQSGDWIQLRGTKNDRARRKVPVLDPLRPYLDRYPADLTARRVTYRLRRSAEAIGVKGASPKWFRRAYITMLVQRLGPAYATVGRLWVGHGEVRVSEEYYRGRDLEYEHGIAASLTPSAGATMEQRQKMIPHTKPAHRKWGMKAEVP